MTADTDLRVEKVLADLREKMKRATPLPWIAEQCGEKEDAPVVGVAYLNSDTDCKNPLSGWLRDFDDDGNEIEYYRETIAYEWQSCDGHSASANVDFVVALVNALPTLLSILDNETKATRSDEALYDAAFKARWFTDAVASGHTFTDVSRANARDVTKLLDAALNPPGVE